MAHPPQNEQNQPIDKFIPLLKGVKRNANNGYLACCPAHDDKTQSLSIKEGNDGRVLLKCFANCEAKSIVNALNLKWSDLFPVKTTSASSNREQKQPLTVEALAKAKGFSGKTLSQWQVAQTKTGQVTIPYFLTDGTPTRGRIRTAISAKEGSRWEAGEGSIVPYGLWLLGQAREQGELVLCEGESDCWTLWSHEIPALGIPGAALTNKLQADHLHGITQIYVVQESDAAGKKFATDINARLNTIGFKGEAYVLLMSKTAKDPNAVYVQCKQKGDDFISVWHSVMEQAQPLAQQVQQETKQTDIRFQSFNTTDVGNSQRLVARHGKDLRYCYPWTKWLVWDGKRWIKDDTADVLRKAKETVKSIYAEAADSLDDSERKSLAKHALRSESETRIKSMVSLSRDQVPVTPDQLDVNHMLLNVLNGTLDLKTGKLQEHRREDYQTKIVPVEFDANAQCPTWEAFLNRIMDGNQELIRFLQKAVGYSLTGDVGEQVMFILYGNTGKNGKSTFLNTCKELLGDYALSMQPESLMAKQSNGGASNHLARLKGARFVPTIEGEEGQRLAESLIKQMTGGDVITARFLHQEFFDFYPSHKIFFATNHLPHIRGTDDAIWRRLRQIPFNVTIPEHERDNKLSEKLRAEFAGILRWAVQGCLMWQQEGLGLPEDIRAATDEYRQEMDVLAAFLNDYCVIASQTKAKASELYAAYKQWCEENGESSMSQKALGTKLKDKGFRNKRSTGGNIVWEGLGLRMEDYKHSDKVVPMKRDIPSGIHVEAASDDMEVFRV